MADSGEYTPETLANRQRMADALLMQALKPREIRSPLAGVGQLGEAALAGWLGYKDEQEQKQGSAAVASAMADLLQRGGGQAMPSAAPAPNAPPSMPPQTMEASDQVPIGTTQAASAVPTPDQYRPLVDNAAAQYGLDPEKFARQINQESGFNPDAVSPAGAQGIAQFMPATAKQYGVNPNDPNSAIPGAARYMGDLSKQFGGDLQKAVAAYNWGPGNVQKWLASGGDPSKVPAETQNYVRSITGQPLAGVPGVAAALSGPQAGAGGGPQGATPPVPQQVAQNAPVPISGASPLGDKIATMLRNKDTNPYVRKAMIGLGQGLIQKQLEGDKPTDEMREYQLYRQQGGKDSFFDYKSGLKKAGAQNIAVNNTVNPIVKGVGERFNDTMDAAKASIPQIQGIHEARRALDQGAITGLGADPKLFLAKAANMFGLDEKSAANTEVARSAIGNSVLAKAKTLGANPSNTDRDYIEKVVGGQIQLEEPSIRRLLDMQEKWARDAIKRANTEGGKLLKAQPKELENIGPLLTVDEPPSYEDFLKANPVTASQAATAGARKVRRYNLTTGKIE